MFTTLLDRIVCTALSLAGILMDTTTAWVRGGILSQAAWTFLDDRHRPKLFLNLSVCVWSGGVEDEA